MDKVRSYIKNAWETAVIKKDNDEAFPMPYDFVPPTAHGYFTNLYYWDTYFTNVGLYLDGYDEYAYQNIECLKYCLREFGCVPNCCWRHGAKTASQPPLLFLMVTEYYERKGDRAFLEDSYDALQIEYRFWMTKRIANNGLNCYGTNLTEWTEEYINYFSKRLRKSLDGLTREQVMEFCTNCNAEGESGEDHTPRFRARAAYVNPVDLNCYLYAFERNMSAFSDILGRGETALWSSRAERRAMRLRKYCLDERTGVFFDYDYQTRERTGVYCVACYLPFVFGLSEDRMALAQINERLIRPHGVTSCQEIEVGDDVYQWGYPNLWAPHQYWAYLANANAGRSEVAKEIAEKYLDTVSREFALSGKLYEKYDAVSGGKATVNEYGLPEMLGWTAGVFNFFYRQIVE